MARPRPVFSARCTSLPLGVGSAGLATLAFAAPPPKGREVQEDKGNLQKHFYTPTHAMIAAGSVVTKDVPPHALMKGNPARISGWVCFCGSKLDEHRACPTCKKTITVLE